MGQRTTPRTSTVPVDDGLGASRRSLWWRRGVLSLLTLFVLPTVYSYLAYQVPQRREAEGGHAVPAE